MFSEPKRAGWEQDEHNILDLIGLFIASLVQ